MLCSTNPKSNKTTVSSTLKLRTNLQERYLQNLLRPANHFKDNSFSAGPEVEIDTARTFTGMRNLRDSHYETYHEDSSVQLHFHLHGACSPPHCQSLGLQYSVSDAQHNASPHTADSNFHDYANFGIMYDGL